MDVNCAPSALPAASYHACPSFAGGTAQPKTHCRGGGAETPFLHLHSSCWCLPRTNARSQRQALTSKATVKLLAEMLNCHAPRGSVPCLTSHLAQET